jgi:GTP-binding protein
MSMTFTINVSPFFGQDGKFVTSRHIQERLTKELEKNLALRVETSDRESAWNVYGRGVLHLSVLKIINNFEQLFDFAYGINWENYIAK